MSNIDLYNTIYSKNRNYILTGNIIIDDVLAHNRPDSRLGISLIIPIKNIEEKFNSFIGSAMQLEPEQYYYPFNDLHITIFDYIQGNENYKRNNETEIILTEVTEKALSIANSFQITFDGIAFSKEAGFIQGYDNNKLIELRDLIRKMMLDYGIKNDERYKSESAHVTFCRFREKLTNPEKFTEFIDANRKLFLGQEFINTVELVEHDWYNLNSKKRIIRNYKLPPNFADPRR